MTTGLDELFDNNRRWAEKTEQRSPGFFTSLLAQQAPQYLWVGCADSRVPANELVGLAPGELFVHRNVANVVAHSDLKRALGDPVRDRSAPGGAHHRRRPFRLRRRARGASRAPCRPGGQLAALCRRRARQAPGLARRVAPERCVDALCELNVIEQARNVCETTIVQDAWARGQALVVHGWFYASTTAVLEDLRMNATGPETVGAAYDAALAAVRARYANEAPRATPGVAG